MAATRQATWRRATHTHTCTHTHVHTISQSHFLSLMNAMNYSSHTATHLSQGAYTAPVSNRRHHDFSLFYYHFSRHFPGCKGIPGGARPLKLSTPPYSSLLLPPPCTHPWLSPAPSCCLSSSQSVFHFLYSTAWRPLSSAHHDRCSTGLYTGKRKERMTVFQEPEKEFTRGNTCKALASLGSSICKDKVKNIEDWD